MTIDGMHFDDDLSAIDARENLWREVIAVAIRDALFGVSTGDSIETRIRQTYEARAYITVKNRDFEEVCYLAGLDPTAVREHLSRQIAKAPSPETLLSLNKRTGKPMNDTSNDQALAS